MVGELIQALKDWASGIVGAWGYGGLAFLMLLDSANIPIPSEVIMPFGGILAGEGKLNLHLVALAGAVGSLLGSAFSYWIGAVLGKEFLIKYGKYVLLRPSEIETAERWWNRFGMKAVFFGRFIPLVRTFISLPAGLYRANFGLFLLLTFLGSLPWCYLWATIGFMVGRRWSEVSESLKWLDYVVLGLIGLLVLRYLWTRRRRKEEPA